MFDKPGVKDGRNRGRSFDMDTLHPALGALPAAGRYYPHYLNSPSHQDCRSVRRYMTQLAKQSSQISVFELSGG
jgi:hypothetical protein